MIPLRDTARSGRFPVVNITLIVVNVIVFFYQLTLSERQLLHFIFQYGVIPREIGSLGFAGLLLPDNWISLITAIFLHGSLLHIISNMLYLWVFGDNVEDNLGHTRYLLFYLLAGIAGNLAHIYANPASGTPTIGASGAVAGVLGAYFLGFPRSKVLSLVPIGFFLTVAEIPAPFFLILWFGLQLINALVKMGIQTAQMVAWWAHIGGFAAGAVMFLILRKKTASRLQLE